MVLSLGGWKYTVTEAVENVIDSAERCCQNENVDYVEILIKGNSLEVNYSKNDGSSHWNDGHKGNWSRLNCETDDEIKAIKKALYDIAYGGNRVNGNRVHYDYTIGGVYIYQ